MSSRSAWPACSPGGASLSSALQGIWARPAGGTAVILRDEMRSSARRMRPVPRADTLGAVSRLTSVRARVLELDPRVADVLLAAALTAGIAAEGALQRIQPQNSRAATLAVTLVLGVLLVWRRTAPPIVAPLAVSWLLALSLLHGETKYGGDFAFAAAIVAVYSLGSFSEGRRTY